MPAKSKKQQRFMGMVRAAQKGEKPASAKVAKVAKVSDTPRLFIRVGVKDPVHHHELSSHFNLVRINHRPGISLIFAEWGFLPYPSVCPPGHIH